MSGKAEPHEQTLEEITELEFLIRKKTELSVQEREILSKKEEILAIQNDINEKLEKLRKIRE